MLWLTTGLALIALGVAIAGVRMASSSSSRTLARTLNDGLEDQNRRIQRLEADATELLERATKQHRRAAQATRRLEQLVEQGEQEADDEGEAGDDGGFDARASGAQGVLPMRRGVDPGPWLGGRTG